jgi:hypothetical protein
VEFTVEASSGEQTPTYQWFKDGETLVGETHATLTLSNVVPTNAGEYHVTATVAGETVASRTAHLLVAEPVPGFLANESVLTDVQPGRSLTVGFTLADGSRQLLVRGVGPSLASFVGEPVLPDPGLTLNRTSVDPAEVVATNAAWGSDTAIADAATATGAFPLTSGEDTALLVDLVPGNYTAVVEAEGATGGKLLMEAYALPTEGEWTGRLINLSALRQIDANASSLTAGFVIDGNVPRQMLLRAVGPSLQPYVGNGYLNDPVLTLHRIEAGVPEQLLQIDDWQDDGSWATTAAAAVDSGAFALAVGSTDAAIAISLRPGAHTVRVDRKGGETGLALLEIYEIP